MKTSLKIILPIIILTLFFILATYLGHTWGSAIEHYIVEHEYVFLGYLAYIGLMFVATVAAPLSTLPLIPIAVSVWGSFIVAILSIIGWSFGAICAFYLSRRYGMPVVRKFVSQEKIERINNNIPQDRNLLASIILLRMVVPVDILSYALGIFPRVTWKPYVIGTIIGILPFSFIFAYLGGLSVKFQIIGLLIITPPLFYFWTKHKT
ncbi:MAG: hypothetical protein COV34_02470 [Candidatus Zambryskibacteria bacterium CG10_big_fil_rev_8_21_14_0_10_42_12]|uniref:TVP38/TMEM64 family membrane protein n=1 Tax=Candidatus Zambryskibacteria bacterium CG10_big_fil_rev_8_21_14_0_10_42_12 TaxID=1975115 RepID=A0A2H0QUH1_9BACT|nr:MAG: hypothetical protein COV34_02470 [Candidatus Zambryskibacteria bacterium CG10_big_fil_rev_8_21_14_0_10_42_12]